ncbi:MAG: TIGR04053 family radical SAM/SPASM domain-containing protein [Chloroflexi bacterium]|nr:TIGR04053 family radical SAM/SPASM domain-containing protein [Chloroflexota bacterium]
MPHPQPRQPGSKPFIPEIDFNVNPFMAFWEVTRACLLSCRHCRAEAQPLRHPQELSTEEGFRLMDQICEMGQPLFIITGGDPMMRPDLFTLLEYGVKKGMRVSLAPSTTPLVTREALQRVKDVGVARISFSIDGSKPETHDAFRRTPGSFRRAVEIMELILEVGLSLQVNTTVSRHNIDDLDALAELVASFKPAMWSLFFLVPTGRGQRDDVLTPQQHEDVFHWLYDLSKRVPFDVKTTAAQHYRRMIVQQHRAEAIARGGSLSPQVQLEVSGPGFNYDAVGRAPKGVNDGNGCLFVSHTGDVYPSGFLPISGGNVREQPLAQVYRQSPLFQILRDPVKLKGKCGRCEYNGICGGSRARAYAFTGDYLAAEPCCVHQPAPKPASVGG